MEHITIMRDMLRHAPTDENLHKLLDFFGFKAQEARTTQPLLNADATKTFVYFECTRAVAPCIYLFPELGVATAEFPFQELVITKIPQRWRKPLELHAVVERRFK